MYFAILCDPPARPPRPRTPAGQAAPPHIFRRRPPGQHDCFFPPNRCYAHLLGTVAVATAFSRHPSPGYVAIPTQPHEFPAIARPAGSARQLFAQGFRLSEVLKHRSCSILASLRSRTRACPLVQRRSCSRRFAALRTPPSGRHLATRPAAVRWAGSVTHTLALLISNKGRYSA